MTAGNIRLGQGTPPAPSVGEGILYFDSGDQQLYAIDAAGATVGPIGVGGGGGVTASNAIWVQTAANGGDDGTGTRGDSTKPFKTIQAALQVAVNGDILYIGTGSFDGPGDIAAYRPGLTDISIVGAGRELTVLVDPGPGNTIDLSGAQWSRFWLGRLTVSAAQYAVLADGSAYAAGAYLSSGAYPSAPWTSGLFLSDVLIEGATGGGIGGTQVYNVGLALFDRVVDSTGPTGSLDVNLVGLFLARDSSFQNVAVTRDYDNVSQPPAPAPGAAQFRRCELDAVALKKQASIELDNCQVGAMAGDKLNVSGGGVAPIIVSIRSIFTAIDLASPGSGELPDTASNIIVVFADCQCGLAEFAVAAPAANFQNVSMLGCTFPPAAPSLSCGDGINGDARSSTFVDYTTSIATPGTGTIALSSFPVAAAATALPTVLTFPFALPSASYVFVPSGDTLGEAPLAVTAQTATTVTITPTAALGGTIGGLVMML